MKRTLRDLQERISRLTGEDADQAQHLGLLTPEGKAQFFWNLENLTETEQEEAARILKDTEQSDNVKPDWRTPEWDTWWTERRRIWDRLHQLELAGKTRAQQRSESEYEVFKQRFFFEQKQLDKVKRE